MKTQTPKYDQDSKDRARYARNLAGLLWRKAKQTMSPEEQELVLQAISIFEMVAVIAPDESDKVKYDFERIARMAEKAEALLIANPTQGGVQWEKFQVLLKEDDYVCQP